MYRVKRLQDLDQARRKQQREDALKSDPNGFGYGTLTAAEMEVAEFRQILVWPLALAHPSLIDTAPGTRRPAWRSADRLTAEVAEKLRDAGPWIEQSDLLQHVDPGSSDPLAKMFAYQEYVYFHPFVQSFLYSAAPPRTDAASSANTDAVSGTSAKRMRLFQRRDLTHADVVLPHVAYVDNLWERRGQWCFSLDIERLNLYLFDCGVAMIAMEVSARCVTYTSTDMSSASVDGEKSLTLDDALRLQNALRRCYAPYLSKMTDGTRHPAEVPERVTLYSADFTPIIDSVITETCIASDIKSIVDAPPASSRPMPLFEHWKKLLPLALLNAHSSDKIDIASWRHVVDERIPSLVFVTTHKSPRELRRGDHVRLCFMDDPSVYPYGYDTSVLGPFEKDNCYDRFWNLGTRHMFSGYAYVLFAQEGSFSRDILRHHFRRHYYQIALLSHMEHAALLTYSGWISAALARDPHRLGAAFAEDVLRIKEELLKFVHQYRFTGLSNQLQPSEMQGYWRRHLKLDELFEDVATEIETARDYLVARENRDQTQAATNISVLAGLAAVIGLPMAFLGTNFITEAHLFGWQGITVAGAVAILTGSVAVSSALALAALWLTRASHWQLANRTRRVSDWVRNRLTLPSEGTGPISASQRLKRVLWGTLVMSLIATLVSLVALPKHAIEPDKGAEKPGAHSEPVRKSAEPPPVETVPQAAPSTTQPNKSAKPEPPRLPQDSPAQPVTPLPRVQPESKSQ